MSDGLITRQELSQDLNEELNKTGILTEIEPSLQATLSDQGKDLNLVNVANAIYNETTKPDWTPALTQMKSIFSVGTGTNPDGVEVDYSNSVTKGQVSDVAIKGRTVVNLLGTKGECDNVSVFNYNSNVTGVVENGRIKITCTNDNNTWRFQIGWLDGIELNKCYFARIDIENTNIPELRFIMSNNINQAFSVSSQQSGKFSLFLKCKFTSANPAYYSIGLTYGATITSGYLNKQCYIDNLALFEITENEYNALSEAELAQKYPYISGTKSTISQRVVSRGKNLFDKSDYILASIDSVSGTITYANNRLTTGFITVKSNTSYVASGYGDRSIFYFYDENKNFLSSLTSNVITTPSNCKFIRFYATQANNVEQILNTLQIEYGTTPTPYEPYKESIAYITLPEGEELHSLPNGVKDEFNISTGVKTQRTKEKILEANDITNYWTSYQTHDWIGILKPTDYKHYGLDTYNSTLIYGSVNILSELFVETGQHVTDSPNPKMGVLFNNTAGGWGLVVPKGTFSNVDEARAALAGTKLIYQLAEPKTYPLNITPLQCFENGTISIEPYLAKKYTITGTSITLDYPIIAIDSIKKLVNNEEQNVTDAILSADGLTISNITAGTYIVEGAIKPEYSTIPTTVMSYPKNTSAQTDGNTEMIGIHSQLLKELILASL